MTRRRNRIFEKLLSLPTALFRPFLVGVGIALAVAAIAGALAFLIELETGHPFIVFLLTLVSLGFMVVVAFGLILICSKLFPEIFSVEQSQLREKRPIRHKRRVDNAP